jgi:hypothetical protein
MSNEIWMNHAYFERVYRLRARWMGGHFVLIDDGRIVRFDDSLPDGEHSR